MVTIGTAGAGMIAGIFLATPVFWVTFAVSVVVGKALLAAVLIGWTLAMTVFGVVVLAALFGPETRANLRDRGRHRDLPGDWLRDGIARPKGRRKI